MNITLNIIVLLIEVLYYSLFMKFARKECRFWKYMLSFSIATIFNIIFSILGINEFVIYFLFIFISIFAMKIFDKEISLFDMLFLFIILIIKIIIEGICFLILYNLINKIIFTFVIDIIKISFVILIKKQINIKYKEMKNKWNNNNFYIRYIFNIFLFVFIIMSFVFIMIK